MNIWTRNYIELSPAAMGYEFYINILPKRFTVEIEIQFGRRPEGKPIHWTKNLVTHLNKSFIQLGLERYVKEYTFFFKVDIDSTMKKFWFSKIMNERYYGHGYNKGE